MLKEYATRFVEYVAAAVSMAAALGYVNILVGILSAAWLATQLFRFWRFEYRRLKFKEKSNGFAKSDTMPPV